MEAFLISTGVVAVAEIGDKTQLLALVLAARYRRPLAIVLGILLATLANHAAAGLAGTWAGAWLAGPSLRWVLGGSFLAVDAWALIPDTLGAAAGETGSHWGAFFSTLVSFFLVEIGDKTQMATVALAAKFASLMPVVIGTTLGLLIANAPIVYFGEAAARRLPVRVIRLLAAALFIGLGGAVLLGVDLSL